MLLIVIRWCSCRGIPHKAPKYQPISRHRHVAIASVSFGCVSPIHRAKLRLVLFILSVIMCFTKLMNVSCCSAGEIACCRLSVIDSAFSSHSFLSWLCYGDDLHKLCMLLMISDVLPPSVCLCFRLILESWRGLSSSSRSMKVPQMCPSRSRFYIILSLHR